MLFSLYLHGYGGFLRPTCAPKNQGKQRKKNPEPHDEGKKITATRHAMGAIITIEKSFFFNGIKFLPGFSAFGTRSIDFMLFVRLKGGRVARRGGLARMRA